MKFYKRKSSITSAKLDNKFSLFITNIGSYVNLNSTASLIWQNLESKLSIEELKKIILNKFEVDEDLLEKDLLSFLERAETLGIVDIYE